MAQIDSRVVFSIIGVIFAVNSIGLGIMWKILAVHKQEFEKHKESVQYKDTCAEVHKGLTKLIDERHKDVKETLGKIEELIRNNGQPKPRVQT